MRHYLLAGADAYLRALDAVHRAHHVVRHTDAQPAVFQRGEDHHRPRLIRVLAQVRQQIIEHALEIHRIRRDAAVADEVDARHVEPVVLQIELQFEHELVEQHPRVKLLHVHLKVGTAENKEILEQLIREILQIHGLAVCRGDKLLRLLLVADAVLVKQAQIAQHRGHRRADIVRYSGYQLGVCLPCAALVAHLLDDRTAHHVHLMREHRKLVVALDGDIVLQVAPTDLTGFVRQHDYALCHPLHVPQHDRNEYQAGRRPRHDVRQRVFAHLRILAYRYLIQPVGKAHRVEPLALRYILAPLRARDVRGIRRLAAVNAH